MSIQAKDMKEYIGPNPYPGRGIVIGETPDGKVALAYFIMGRSQNSRNRVLTVHENGHVYTEPFDFSKVEDPSLIIYRAVADVTNHILVTNGDQTDTLFHALANGSNSRVALDSRQFEPDAPNFTPRISGVITTRGSEFSYEMSILKSADEKGSACNRFFYSYAPLEGYGHFIHTYEGDGSPLPTFEGEPRRVIIPDCIEEFAHTIWDNLNEENRIALYVQYTNLVAGTSETRLINKYV